MWTAPRRDHNRVFLTVMAALVGIAWLALWLSEWSGSHGFLHVLHDLDAFSSGVAFMAVFVSGWSVMVIAMMLPSSLPLISMFRSMSRGREDHNLLVALLIIGYLTVWSLFGVAVFFGGWALQEAVSHSGWLSANAWALGAGVLSLAGLYQFTPLKYKCLDKCRSPFTFMAEHWRGSREKLRSFTLGAHHGLFCVGCCWSLMLLMFLVGSAGALLWMLVLGAVMAVEKNAPWGRRIGVPLGVVLLGAGLTFGTAQALQAPEQSTAGESIEADDANAIRVPLASADGFEARGSATFTDTADGVEVKLQARGLPEAGERYLAHLHPGSCAEDPADEARDDHGSGRHHNHDGSAPHANDSTETLGEIEHPLESLVAQPDGSASSISAIEDTTNTRLFAGKIGYYVNVHAEASGSGRLPTLACGDLREEEEATEHDHEEGHHDH